MLHCILHTPCRNGQSCQKWQFRNSRVILVDNPQPPDTIHGVGRIVRRGMGSLAAADGKIQSLNGCGAG